MKIIRDMSNTEYHAHSAVSKSVLDKIAKSPLHCRAYLDGQRTEPTAAMQFGTALHTAVLEPSEFRKQFAVFDGDRRTAAGKAEYAALVASNKQIITRADNDAITTMSAAVFAHPIAGELLTDGHAESSVFWTDADTGIECKCRPDWWRNDRTVIDVKTTEDASPAGFAKSVAAFRYHVQAAHYLAGTQANRFVFIAVEKKAPFAVAVYELDAVSLEVGMMIRNADLLSYKLAAESNYWPSYSENIEVLTLPAWAFPKSTEEEIEVEYV
jgi:exodeoxyribonuclease VIII